MNKRTADAVIVAAGSGSRSGLDVPKQFYEIEGRPVLAYTAETFIKADLIGKIVVVLPNDNFEHDRDYMHRFIHSDKVVYVRGDKTRMESVFEGLKLLANENASEVVCIHDGVRMFVDTAIIEASVDCALKYGAALTAIPMTDTVKEVKNSIVCRTLDRSCLYAAQTPQAFRFKLIYEAYKKAMADGMSFTDDCAVAEYCNIEVHITNGSKKNIKLTLPEDFCNL